MKKLLLLCVPLMFSCGENEELGKDNNSENRVLLDELTNKSTDVSPLMYYKSELFNGIGFDIYEDGELEFEGNYIDGKRNGLQKYWYENGQLHKEENYKDGKKNGLHKEWYKNGQLYDEENYIDGKSEGLHKRYYKNGQLKMENNLKNGKLKTQKMWSENGQIVRDWNLQ